MTDQITIATNSLKTMTGEQLTDAILESSYVLALSLFDRDEMESIDQWERYPDLTPPEAAYIAAWNSAYVRMHTWADKQRTKREAMPVLFKLMAREFPDFDQSTLPVIPHYWQDLSWHNDVSPSFSATPAAIAGTGVTVWIDYADPAARQFSDTSRFGAYLVDDAGERISEVEGNDWGTILAGVDAMREEWDAICAVNEAKTVQTFGTMCAEFQKWAIDNARPEGDACDNLFHDDNTPEQQRWLSGFITRWNEMEETVRELKVALDMANKRNITTGCIESITVELNRIQEGR